jgi:hypothetical protein
MSGESPIELVINQIVIQGRQYLQRLHVATHFQRMRRRVINAQPMFHVAMHAHREALDVCHRHSNSKVRKCVGKKADKPVDC